ncbi:unnamed protein product [Polarella glacialis]|uniref:Uncharacterized protein n=1 Tax=Polarella glacialis TaxID=89957 RepID=A0A813DUA6_POLGL|nr:unnamed protein product [Polarella glacialis]CAE8589895.1 unnamed protein product [Polarella glacialis]
MYSMNGRQKWQAAGKCAVRNACCWYATLVIISKHTKENMWCARQKGALKSMKPVCGAAGTCYASECGLHTGIRAVYRNQIRVSSGAPKRICVTHQSAGLPTKLQR